VPEVLALPIMVGSEAYLSWLDRSLMKWIAYIYVQISFK
jgi:hypothetical protein